LGFVLWQLVVWSTTNEQTLPAAAADELPDVNAVAITATATTIATAAPTTPAVIATAVPGLGSRGRARRSLRGTRLDWLAPQTKRWSGVAGGGPGGGGLEGNGAAGGGGVAPAAAAAMPAAAPVPAVTPADPPPCAAAGLPGPE